MAVQQSYGQLDEAFTYVQNGRLPPAAQNEFKKHSREEEQRETGRVKWRVYKAYYKASGGALPWLVGVAILLLGHFLTVARTWSLKELSQQATSEAIHLTSQAAQMAASLVHTDDSIGHSTWRVEHGIFFCTFLRPLS